MRTDNPIADFNRWDDEREAWLETLPKCSKCGEPIQQEKVIHYNDKYVCEDCEDDFWQDIRGDFLVLVND